VERLNTLKQDLTLAVRALVSHKTWSAVVLLTLAIGIGANSTLFTVVNAVLLRPLPYPQADRIVSLSESDKSGDRAQVADITYFTWQAASRSFQSLAAYAEARAVVSSADDELPEFTDGQHVTASYFSVLGVRPSLGRAFTEEEARQTASPVVLLSDQLWRRRFGGDTALIGRSISVDQKPTTVIGIMPPTFASEQGAQFWSPLSLPAAPDQRSTFYFSVIGRLRPGVTVERARDELMVIGKQADGPGLSDTHTLPVVMTLHERLYGDARPALVLLFSAVTVLLLIASANIASLMLVRAARRQREFAIRIAIGAGRWRIVRYLLCESLLLGIGGGLLGLLIPLMAVRPLVSMAPPTVANVAGISVDGSVLMFTFGVSVLTGLLVGLVPGMEAGRGSLSMILSNGGGRIANTRQRAVRQTLIVAELATALVLLTCAGLVTRSFMRVLAIDPGFLPASLQDVAIELPPTDSGTISRTSLFPALLERARGLPGVESAALADVLPFGGASRSYAFDLRGRRSPVIDHSVVTPGYFSTIGARVISGRALSASDHRGAQLVAVVNQSLAHALYGNAEPVGQKLKVPGDSGRGAMIVGVVNDMPRRELEAGAHPTVYVPLTQAAAGSDAMHLVLRTRGDANSVVGAVREVIRDIDPSIPAPRLRTMQHVMETAVAPRRFSFVLLGIFAALAATLAAIGLYGVIASLVADRTREIGIRVALGAQGLQVVRLVVAQGMRLLVVGLALGLLASLGAVRLLRSMIFGVGMYDPWSFIVATLTLGVVALGASYLPAVRAASTDPLVSLRNDV